MKKHPVVVASYLAYKHLNLLSQLSARTCFRKCLTTPLIILYSKRLCLWIYFIPFHYICSVYALPLQHFDHCSICQVPLGKKEAGGSEGPVVVNVMFVVSSPCWCIVSQNAATVCQEGHYRCSLIHTNTHSTPRFSPSSSWLLFWFLLLS